MDVSATTTTTNRTETREAARAAPPAPSRPRVRITPQMIIFALLIVAIVGGMLYTYIDSAISGGIKDLGGGFKQVDLKAMSTFSMDQVNGTIEDVPKKWRDLDGQKVVFYGEMWEPRGTSDGKVAMFDLCYSIAKCCFSGPPQVQHFVKATVMPGRTAYYYGNQVKVTGVLHVDVKRDAEGAKLGQVFAMDVESIEPVR